MRRSGVSRLLFAACVVVIAGCLAGCGRAQGKQAPPSSSTAHPFFRVRVSPRVCGPLNGRLLLFVNAGSSGKELGLDEFKPKGSWVTAREVRDLQPGDSVEVDGDDQAYPASFSAMPAGDYQVQAVLDVDHRYPYSGRTGEDWVSEVVPMAKWTPGSKVEPVLTLDRQPGHDFKKDASLLLATTRARLAGATKEEFASPALSRFWGHPVAIRAWVFPPPGYSGQSASTYPVAYWTHGFGGDLDSGLFTGLKIYDRMKSGEMPPMIWVMLDESTPQGTHEFADSVNNGPWGTALTSEFLPDLEAKYRMDAKPSGRLLTGHSSGGWATLQLQVNYPLIFGGTWSTSPDPSDFHDFNGVDLYSSHANLYRYPDGTPVPLMRGTKVSLKEAAQAEAVTGEYGGQLASFEWVFSPKGEDGAPLRMFNRRTGDIDASVMEYWKQHYDLAHLVTTYWAERGPMLKGKIHVLVGTADTFYLDGPARKLDAVLSGLGAEARFTYLEGRTHLNLYEIGNDPDGLLVQISREMYATARPGEAAKR